MNIIGSLFKRLIVCSAVSDVCTATDLIGDVRIRLFYSDVEPRYSMLSINLVEAYFATRRHQLHLAAHLWRMTNHW